MRVEIILHVPDQTTMHRVAANVEASLRARMGARWAPWIPGHCFEGVESAHVVKIVERGPDVLGLGDRGDPDEFPPIGIV